MPILLLTVALLLAGCAGMPAPNPDARGLDSPAAVAPSAVSASAPAQSPIAKAMSPGPSAAPSEAPRGTVAVAGRTIPVEIMDTPAGREHGLSGRTSLAAETGMLFVWPSPQVVKFWMPDMNFAIDIIFARAGRVIGIYPDAQPCPTRGDCPTFGPDEGSDQVLEVPAGSSKRWGLKLGDPLVLKP